MDNSVGPLLIAVVAVLGTLLAPVVAGRLGEKSKQKEFERARSERLEQVERDEAERSRLERRQCYITLNTAARTYHRALRTWAYAMDQPVEAPAEHAELMPARQAFQAIYSEAQMVATASVFHAAQKVAGELANVYRTLKRMEEGIHDAATESTESARADLDAVWDHLWHLRVAMRSDLGLPTL